MKLVIGKEYEVQQRFAVLERIEGDTGVFRDRWDSVFECDLGYAQEKKVVKPSLPKRRHHSTKAVHGFGKAETTGQYRLVAPSKDSPIEDQAQTIRRMVS